jgi:hypothetical protein
MLTPLTQFHENPRIIAWWQARLGPVLDWLTPVRRRTILALLSVYVCFKELKLSIREASVPLVLPQGMVELLLVVVLLLALSWLVFRLAVSFARLPAWVRKHPQLCLHAVYWALLFGIWQSEAVAQSWRGVLVAVGLMFPYMLWRFGYVLMPAQFGRIAGTRFRDHLLAMWPAWGGSNVPYGNGFGYMSRFEAKDRESLARSQLAGTKLLLLGLVLDGVWSLFKAFVYGPGTALTGKAGGFTLGIPRLNELAVAGGSAAAPGLSWLSVYCELIFQVLRHAVIGHYIIGVLRLAGFHVFRNTYKPLLAESIVEFWNRYYFYFKELMANFFFLPVFTQTGRLLRAWPTLRLFLAVFAAAGVGNMYYHLLNQGDMLVAGQVGEAVYDLRSRFFYCFLLSLGIFISMLREQRRGGKLPPEGTWGSARRWFRRAGVWTFFGLIFIWNAKGGGDFSDRVAFFFSLFGWS